MTTISWKTATRSLSPTSPASSSSIPDRGERLTLPPVVPDFRLVRRLSWKVGGSEVWLAEDPTGQMVALKVLTPEGAARDDLRHRFATEADLVTRLGGQHHVVAGHSAAPAIVLELGEGSLGGRLSRGPLPVKIARIVARQLLDAIGWLHENGVVHRDVKPSNILMMEDGTIRLGDLGVAATGHPPRGLPEGWVEEEIGTLGYAAPELLRNPGDVTPLVDIYSAGVVCYEMVSGVLPFAMAEGETEPAFRERLAAGPLPTPLTSVAPDVSGSFATAVMEAIDPDPAVRPASAAELGRALGQGA